MDRRGPEPSWSSLGRQLWPQPPNHSFKVLSSNLCFRRCWLLGIFILVKTRRSEERRELETSGVKSVRNIQRPDGRSTISWCLGRCPGLAASCLPFVKPMCTEIVICLQPLRSSGNCSVNSRLEINQIANCLVDGSVMCAFKCGIFIVMCLFCEAIYGYSHEPKVKLGISYVAHTCSFTCALFMQQH